MMDDTFDIDFTMLPPKLQMQLWILALDADTSKVNIAYKHKAFLTNLTYSYGGNVEAALSIRRFTAKAGLNPGNGDVNFGLVFKGFKFGTTANFTKDAVGIEIGYGGTLLPFPEELTGTFNSAGHGLQSMAGDIQAAPDNPLAWYKMHSDDAKVLGKAITVGRQIAEKNKAENQLAVGLRLNYIPQFGFTIYGGVQFQF
jgi:hypothetical protein